MFPRTPYCMFSWRYLVPGENSKVKLHRRAFIASLSRRPRILWWLIALHSYFLWYVFNGWRQCYRVWLIFSVDLSLSEGLGRGKQLKDLLILTFLYTTPPRFYYSYRLYQCSQIEWFDFIYTHELPYWHNMISPRPSVASCLLLSNKAVFSQVMLQRGIPAVKTSHHIINGKDVNDMALFQKQSLFLKPSKGSRKQGCFTLLFNHASGQYQLQGKGACVDENIAIKTLITEQSQRQEYLIQPLLINHTWFSKFLRPTQLITLRIITVFDGEKSECISAIMEIPVSESLNQVIPVGIDITTGRLFPCEVPYKIPDDRRKIIDAFEGQILPYWQEATTIAKDAHLSCGDITTVGWDLALTNQGIKILEGNINWGVEVHQYGGKCLLPIFNSM